MAIELAEQEIVAIDEEKSKKPEKNDEKIFIYLLTFMHGRCIVTPSQETRELHMKFVCTRPARRRYRTIDKNKRKVERTMKKMIALILALVMALSLVACGNNNTEDDTKDYASMSLEELKAELTTVTEGKLTMSTNATFPPYEMLADDGSFEGIDVEVAGAIAEKLGLELQIDDMSFDAALLAVQGDSPKADIVMAGVTVTEDRQLVMNFSDSYATGIQVVIVKEGSDIKSIDDLEGKKIGTQMGTTGYIYCSDTPENGGYGEENVIAYDSGITAVQALVNGQVDCVVIDNEPAQAYVKANAGLSILDTEFTNEDYAIGMNKGNACLLAAVNAAMAELKADGTFQKIVEKYIPAE